VRGFAAWSGRSGNYWGHNALIRIESFRAASRLPVLSGPAPFGGPLLSHDFVEAAWIRRAGWQVELDPDHRGSAEDAPQTLEEFHRRDRRWCQGNLQHLRLLAEPGLHPLSRFHMISGVFSYLAAPVWLSLMIMGATGAVEVDGAAPLLLVALLLMIPKICGLVSWLRRPDDGRAAPRGAAGLGAARSCCRRSSRP
jgi:membrane glycosyltransferase